MAEGICGTRERRGSQRKERGACPPSALTDSTTPPPTPRDGEIGEHIEFQLEWSYLGPVRAQQVVCRLMQPRPFICGAFAAFSAERSQTLAKSGRLSVACFL